MNKQEFIEKIKASSINAASKQKILDLLAGEEFGFETKEAIRDIIQADIDADSADLLTEEDRKEVDASTEEMSQELDAVEKDLADDMKFVEDEMNDLTAIIGDLDKVADQLQINQIKSSI